MNSSRDKFEKSWNAIHRKSVHENLFEFCESGDVSYSGWITQEAWELWQAATEQSQKEIEALQAREKVLVEALQNLVEDISKTHGNYTYEQAWINADEALANVRGE